MKKIILFVLLSYNFTLVGQKYSYPQIFDSANVVLEEHFGKELTGYFGFDGIDLTYVNWFGNIKYKYIQSGEKGSVNKLVEGFLVTEFNHPELSSYDLKITLAFTFDKKLQLIDSIDIYEIPKFARENYPCNWLLKEELIGISDTLCFEKEITKIYESIRYDKNLKDYYWFVEGFYGSEGEYSLYENFHINIVTGEIFNHSFDRFYKEGHFF